MRHIISVLLVLSVLFSCCGCSDQDETKPISDVVTGHFPVTVTDHAGREVIIESEPMRLVSCYYITSSVLMALELDEKMVGIEDNPDYRPIYGLSSPRLLDLPWVGTAKVLDAEACAALEPDLVILPLRLRDSAGILEELGIDVLLVNPENQQLLVEMIHMIGEAAGKREEAQALTAFLTEQEAYLNEKLTDAEAPAVYLAGNSSFLSTAGNMMYQSDMIRLGGGKNVASDIEDAYWADIDYEQLLAWDPEYIILASSAKYTVEDVLTDPNLAECKAVKNRNVYKIPSDAESWDSPVPGSILGAFWLANILHPDIMTEAESLAIMDSYYETFYQFTYSEK